MKSTLVILLIVYISIPALGVKINSVLVPSVVMNGTGPVILGCNYTLDEDEVLYAVKWYKNLVEFYRFTPVHGPGHISLRGIDLDIQKSNATHIYLNKVNQDTHGAYLCEVVTDGPNFKTVWKAKIMHVVFVPNVSHYLNKKNSTLQHLQEQSANSTKPTTNININIRENIVVNVRENINIHIIKKIKKSKHGKLEGKSHAPSTYQSALQVLIPCLAVSIAFLSIK